MQDKIPYFVFRTIARIFGSIFFPLFTGWGENENLAGKCKVVFARDYGFVTILNLFRFFSSPVAFIVNKNIAHNFVWRVLKEGGVRVIETEEAVSANVLHQLISSLAESEIVSVFLMNPANKQRDCELIGCFKENEVLFFAQSNAGNSFFLGFIPVVKDMKVLCTVIPAFSEQSKAELDGFRGLEFLENSLEKTPQFELPTFFFNHSKFKTEDPNFEEKITNFQ
ncbi:MAG: hypothetical protein Kow0029_28610 [Candidatus Rifleibacteriota bacterium]